MNGLIFILGFSLIIKQNKNTISYRMTFLNIVNNIIIRKCVIVLLKGNNVLINGFMVKI